MNEFNNQSQNDSQKLQVWSCHNCAAIHFKAGNVLLNFNKSEFAELTHAVMEIYEQEFGGLEFYRLINSISHHDDVLSSPTIA